MNMSHVLAAPHLRPNRWNLFRLVSSLNHTDSNPFRRTMHPIQAKAKLNSGPLHRQVSKGYRHHSIAPDSIQLMGRV